MEKQQRDLEAEQQLLETIQPLSKRTYRFPFYFLRVWLFSLIALIALPVGLMLVAIGTEMDGSLDRDWQETVATVSSNDRLSMRYSVEDSGDIRRTYTIDDFVSYPAADTLTLSGSLCDFVAWGIIPTDRGTDFSVWVNPDKLTQVSCVPITREAAVFYMLAGYVLIGLSALRLVRTINAAAIRKG